MIETVTPNIDHGGKWYFKWKPRRGNTRKPERRYVSYMRSRLVGGCEGPHANRDLELTSMEPPGYG